MNINIELMSLYALILLPLIICFKPVLRTTITLNSSLLQIYFTSRSKFVPELMGILNVNKQEGCHIIY